MKWFFKVLITPSVWTRTRATSIELDRFINQALDNGCKPEWESDYRFRLNGVELWGGNYPYGFGSLCNGKDQRFPKRSTVLRLGEIMHIGDLEWHALKQINSERDKFFSGETK